MSPIVQRILLTAAAGAVGALVAVPELAAYTALLSAVAGVLLGKAHLSKPGEAPNAPRTP